MPVIVKLYVPDLAGLFTRTVRTEESDPDKVDGFHDEEVREGKPPTLRVTVPVKPCSAVTLTVSEPVLPRPICSVVGDAEREKLPVDVIASVTLTE